MILSTCQVKPRLIRQALGRWRLTLESSGCHTLATYRGQVVICRTLTISSSCLQLTTPTVKMATRRSARLSALAVAQLNDAAAPILPPPAPAPKSRKRKASVEDEGAPATEEPQLPSTPQKRKVSKKTAPPPATPTPAAAALLSSPAVQKPKPAAVSRLADPNKTNAPLLSPQTSRVVSSSPIRPRDIRDGLSPSKPQAPGWTTKDSESTTTENILEKACAHLIAIDPRMKPLIDKHPCRVFSPEGLAEQIDPFESLVSSIISQQVSGAAAKSIKAKFVALFEEEDDPPSDQEDGKEKKKTQENDPTPTPTKRRFPTPAHILAKDLPTLRTAGLSQRKAEYIHGLAAKFASGELSASLLASAPYEELVAKLVAVRGLGLWTVEMFACFALKRMDVFSLGDLGVQRGMAAFVGRDVKKLKNGGNGNGKDKKWKYMSEAEMREISERFRPYRSLFMWYMWRVEETDVSTME
ncbi:DNA glycosylase [Neurospora crassa]|uniref:DNA-3-methyladenine glycosylase n=2 Tax=Neurospora crassa TaxID=5141 RepID=Q1K6S4_NEUCR|nr:DNA-3-methyladenine glycosylase [Neurospora crassa OR74A]EAA31569.2 DNA-3-methyladenine glycosylase [Neurospora crassa OR74A]KHE78895.1 DNA glycosylase [Neurospora crassa]|eukprot:XP_960805.2 DNA-3-methyladenine glycosylase [Neurospora crassa OR74A]